MDHEEVLIGTVGRANGLRGDVVVRVRTDEPEMRFAVGAHAVSYTHLTLPTKRIV